MIIKDIPVSYTGAFSQKMSAVLVPGDVQAYRVVYKTPFDLTGASFSVTAIRADGSAVSDVGTVSENTGYYTLKNSMYSQPGIVTLRLTINGADGVVLTAKELLLDVTEGVETDISADDRVPALNSLISQAESAVDMAQQASEQAQQALEDAETGLASKADKQTENGGFAAGSGASANYGGAIGEGATTFSGGAVGSYATASIGGAVGQGAVSNDGGGAMGSNSLTHSGGAVGREAKTSSGFAGGNNAKTINANGTPIDAIQLGTGTNPNEKTLQVYNCQLMDAAGNIPKERVASAIVDKADKQTSFGGFAGGNGANTSGGCAVGDGAVSSNGAAVGKGAIAGDGFAGGNSARASDMYGNPINSVQLGTGTNPNVNTLQVYNYQMMDADGNIPAERLTNAPATTVIDNLTSTSATDALSAAQGKALNDGKADKQTSTGGFAGGAGSSETSGGGSIGMRATANNGGGSVGYMTISAGGGSVGNNAKTNGGGSIGQNATSTSGGAVGQGAVAGNGFSGGYNAKVNVGSGGFIDAIQLGTGTNSNEKTLQVYDYQLMNADGKIPQNRLPDGLSVETADGGFAAGSGASATFGGAIGGEATTETGGAVGYSATSTYGGAVGMRASTILGGAVGHGANSSSGGAVGRNATATLGGAVGHGARTSNGFAGGDSARTMDSNNNYIDAIQLGTGTNPNEKTLQVYNYQLMDATGNIPQERILQAVEAILTAKGLI